MKIAFFTDEYYPTFGANTLLIHTLCRELIARGHTCYVLPAHSAKSPATETYEGVRIVRGMPADGKDALQNAVKRLRLVKAFRIFGQLLRQKHSVHDLRGKKGIAAQDFIAEFIKTEKIDAVVSICCSIELSFPLLSLREKGKLPCRWILYMIDPFESHEYYRSHAPVAFLRKLQHRIMRQCDAVAATKLIKDEMRGWEETEILDKTKEIEFPKIVFPEQKPCEDDVSFEDGLTHIVCTGTRNEQARNSAYTMFLCGLLSDIPVRFHFIGHGWTSEEIEQDGNKIFYAPRSWQVVQNMQLNADFLLNIGNKVVNQIPSKVLEYIAAGKPIINVYKNENCPTLALLEHADAIGIDESKAVEEEAGRLRAYLEKKHEKPDRNAILRAYRQFTPGFVADRFCELLTP